MKSLKIAAISLLALPLAACGVTTIDEGERVVWAEWGVATGTGEPGFHFYNPISTDAIVFDVREQKREGTTNAYTKDVQNAKINYTLTYALDPTALLSTYKRARTDWESKYLDQNIERSIKDVFGTKEAVADIVAKRSEVQDLIEANLRERLKKNRIMLASFEITDVVYSSAFEAAVEAKEVATQKAEAAVNRTVEKRELATQKVIAAEAEAKSVQVIADALTRNPKYVELRRLEVQEKAAEKWDGKLPQNMYGSGAVPFVNIPAQ